MRFKPLLVVPILLSLTSCEYFYSAEIRNETSAPIRLTIQFNKDSLEKYWPNNDYAAYLRAYPNYNNIEAIAFDTIALTKTFIVRPKSMFPIEGGMARPDFSLINQITIDGKEKIVLSGNADIQNAFKQTHEYLLEFVVK